MILIRSFKWLRRPQNFANFWPPFPSMSAVVRIEPTPLPRESASVRQNSYCVVNILRDSRHLISHFLDEWQICEVKNPLFYALHFWPKGPNCRGQKCVFLTKNFGQKYLDQKCLCTKTAFLTKFSGQKWPKFFTTTVVSKCCVKKGQKRSEQSWSEVYKKCIFGQKFWAKIPWSEVYIKTALLTKLNGQKWPKFLPLL